MAQKIEGIEWVSTYEAGQMLDCDYWEIKRRVEAGELRGKDSPYGLMVLLVGEDVADWDKDEQDSAEPLPMCGLDSSRPSPATSSPTPALPTPPTLPTPPAVAPQPSDIGPTITAPEAAAMLGVSHDHVRKLVTEGRINGWKENNRWRILLDDVERYQLEQRHWAAQGGRWTPYGRNAYIGGRSDNSELARPARGSLQEPRHTAPAQEPAGGDRWITRTEAAAILAVCRETVTFYAERGRLQECFQYKKDRRSVVRPQICLLLSEVLALAAERESREWRRATSPGKWRDGPTLKPLVRSKIEAPPGDRLISRREAAFVLGVAVGRVSALVAKGRLFGWQTNPGKPGCRLLLSERQVIRYRDDPMRYKGLAKQPEHNPNPNPNPNPTDDEDEDRPFGRWYQPTCRYQRNKPRPKAVPILPEWKQKFDERPFHWRGSSPATERDHGEYFTGRQVGKLLGVGPGSVQHLRESGRLKAYRRPVEKSRGGGNRWFFYRKDDVYALLADPDYLRAHRRGQKAWQTRKERA